MKRRIAIVDSDKGSLKLLKSVLSANGYEVSAASEIAEGYALISSDCPDIVLLSPDFPDGRGIRLIKSIREWSKIPVIIISDKLSERLIVEVIDAGADDYIEKPFSPGLLLAKLRISVRHIEEIEALRGIIPQKKYIYGKLSVDYDKHIVLVGDKIIHLTKNEFKILSLLCRYSGRVLTYDYIMRSVWGPQTGSNNGILRVNITNIRRKLDCKLSGQEYIFTENGIGYRISETEKLK